ncbi:hypothetical protein LX64_03630 [Chitinophaga skermanii]|uniref:Beta-ketoacyl synthase-like protein n=1 Tax=Chitinophaga skermanii TaxID=331697 RepID=A0A327QDQ8_9BACT|nr:hypothetical protein [Chitinophaga skermanii]RAJ02610.1 hypothetical protein LX64_03630 [Chitinophaga skermanii]
MNLTNQHTYITASVTIRPHAVRKNGEETWKSNGEADFLRALYDQYAGNYPKYHKMDALSKLGWLGTEILLQNTLPADKYAAGDVGIILANSSSSQDTDERYFDTVSDIASPALFVYTLPNIVIGEISIRHKLKGENSFFIFDKFDTAFIATYVQTLFDSNTVQACICGWVEQYGSHYDGALFLVEKEPGTLHTPFNGDTLNKLYQI